MMKAIARLALIFAAVVSPWFAVAAEPTPETPEKVTYLRLAPETGSPAPAAGGAAPVAVEDRQLDLRRADFETFAKAKLREMNDNHILSRSRMQIRKGADGLYQAFFHQLDGASITCKVNRSASRSAQFVAVLSYQEQVLSANCSSPDECRNAEFVAVEVIHNRHIFVYSNGGWQ